MTDKEIALLLDTRNAVCKLASWYEHNPDTSAIDAILSEVAPGTDNRVDLALGRMCAVLPDYDAVAVQVVTALERSAELEADLEMTRRIWNEAQPIEY